MGETRRKQALGDMRQVCPVRPRKRSFEFCSAMAHSHSLTCSQSHSFVESRGVGAATADRGAALPIKA